LGNGSENNQGNEHGSELEGNEILTLLTGKILAQIEREELESKDLCSENKVRMTVEQLIVVREAK
jgi:hypothetical protein